MKQIVATNAMVLVAGWLAGCAAQGGGGQKPWTPVALPEATAAPRVIVYGDLQRLLPEYREQPALERFLYGPRDTWRPRLRNPQGLACAAGSALVCDQGFQTVTRVDAENGRITGFSDSAYPPRCPVDACTDDVGRVYVADTTLLGVLVYEASGKFVELLRPQAEPSMDFRPCSVVVRNRTLYVGNLGQRSIARYDLDAHAWLDAWRPPSLVAPTGLCATEDGLLAADAVRSVVHRFSYDGESVGVIGEPGRGPGQFVRPKHVVQTRRGLIFVTDAGRQSIEVFSRSGGFLFELIGDGSAWEGFTLPAGLVVADETMASVLAQRCGDAGGADVDEWVLATDALGRMSIVVLGVVVD